MKQTAVEWYEIEINSLIEKYEAKEISKRDFITMKHNLFYDAKEMEKQQQGYSEEEVELLLETLSKVLVYQGNGYRLPHYFEFEIQQVIEQFKKK